MSSRNRIGRGRKRRGAALFEALIASVLITTFLGATWFFHELHARKGETLRLARYQAWAATRAECQGPVRGSGTQTGTGLTLQGISVLEVTARLACATPPMRMVAGTATVCVPLPRTGP